MLSRLKPQDRSGKTFQYDRLSVDGNEIRVLCLRPAILRSAPIKCTIRHHSVADPLKYVALSYSWEDAPADQLISLNKKEFRVRPNLESALRHLRLSIHSSLIWIDAICINQDDNREREQQVPLMKDIYQNAAFVAVWLGPHYMESHRAMGLVKSISDRYSKLDDGKIQPKFLEWMINTTSPASPDCAWEPLVALLRRSWWTRLWVIQEVALPKTVIVLCGTHGVNLLDFFYCYAAVNRCVQHIRRKLYDREVQTQNIFQFFRQPEFYERLEQALGFFKAALHNGLRRLTLFIDYSPTSLLQLVISYRASKASDARDKIYGLLGLISDRQHKDVRTFRPNYDIPVVRLYTSFAQYCINESGLGEILEECQSPPSKKETLQGRLQEILDEIGPPSPGEMLQERQNSAYVQGLPSWVPDWTTKRRCTRLSDLTFEGNQFNASGDLKASFSFSPEGDMLSTDAIVVDFLERVGPEFVSTDPPLSFRQIAAASIGTLTGREMDRGEFVESRSVIGIEKFYAEELERQYVAGGTVYNAWRRTLHCSQSHSRVDSEAFIEDQFQLPTFLPKQRPMTEVGWDLRLYAGLNHRRYSVSSLGYTCLVPEAAKVGDCICVILGVNVPFVIRKSGDNHILVGECYVQGLMEAEAVTKMRSGIFKSSTLRLV
jgi:hypothetical protein